MYVKHEKSGNLSYGTSDAWEDYGNGLSLSQDSSLSVQGPNLGTPEFKVGDDLC
jgi:hypothetical protein